MYEVYILLIICGGINMPVVLEERVLNIEKINSVVSLLRGVDMTNVNRRLSKKLRKDTKFVDGLREEASRFLGLAVAGNGHYTPSQIVNED